MEEWGRGTQGEHSDRLALQLTRGGVRIRFMVYLVHLGRVLGLGLALTEIVDELDTSCPKLWVRVD